MGLSMDSGRAVFSTSLKQFKMKRQKRHKSVSANLKQ